MQRTGWVLCGLTGVFAAIGAAPFGGGAFLAAVTFLISLFPTARGALLPGLATLLFLLAALALTPVDSMHLKAESSYLAVMAVVLLAFSLSFFLGLKRRRAVR